MMHDNSFIVTLNHDNLANKFTQKPNRLVSLHGVVTPEMKIAIKVNLPDIIFYDIRKPFLKNVFLATKENEKLLLNGRGILSFFR